MMTLHMTSRALNEPMHIEVVDRQAALLFVDSFFSSPPLPNGESAPILFPLTIVTTQGEQYRLELEEDK